MRVSAKSDYALRALIEIASRGDGAPVERAELGQKSEQRAHRDPADARHTGQQRGALLPHGGAGKVGGDLVLELSQRRPQPAQQGLDRGQDGGLLTAPRAVALGLDQLRELAPAQHQRRQRMTGGRARRARHRAHALAIKRQRVGIEPVGFRQQPGGTGEIAHLARVDHRDRDPDLLERHRQHPLQATGSLDHHQQARLTGEPRHQTRDATPVPAECSPLAARQQADVEPPLTDIDTNITLKLTEVAGHGHPRMRA